jgi:D-lactate dehydrogenase
MTAETAFTTTTTTDNKHHHKDDDDDDQAQRAYQLLKGTSLLAEASETLLRRLAAAMTPVQASNGHVLVQEGRPLQEILILEQGKLLRTKYAANHPDDVDKRHHRRDSLPRGADRLDYILQHSVVVDSLEGRGRLSGLLHSIRPGGTAFATVVATGDHVKVWLLPAVDFRNILNESPAHAMDIMNAMARELRSGSKSLRGLMQAVQSSSSKQRSASFDSTTPSCRVLVYDATTWTTQGFEDAVKLFNRQHTDELYIDMNFTTERLSERTATFAAGYDAVCLFVNDVASTEVVRTLSLLGVKLIAMRCAGFDRVDTKAAKAFQMTVARVPAYSPYAVAEMAVALLMTVNRKIHHASNRVKMANFTLDAGLMGMDIHGKTVGVMGTGKIGQILCDIMLGFGVELLCYDVYEQPAIQAKGGVYVSQDEIFARCDVLMLCMPLIPPTYHTIHPGMLHKLKPGVLLINTSRGGLVDTTALIEGLRSGVIGGAGMDVYENEQEYFFQDWSAKHVADQDLQSLLGNNNVVLTAHQAFFTKEAVSQIVNTTLTNVHDFSKGLTGQDHPNNCIPGETK